MYAEADVLLEPQRTPNDSLYSSQWHYFEPAGGVGLPGAWDTTIGSSGITVAVIDTGLVAHADVAGRAVPGYDFTSDARIANDGDGRDRDASDPGDWITAAESSSGFFAGCPIQNSSWHGTHVAGTVAAATNNAVGVSGIDWASKLQPVRVLGKCGGYLSDIADAMRWAAGLSVPGTPLNANPARVINLSLGGSGACSATLQSAVDSVIAAGTVVVAAAGNNAGDAGNFQPANCNGVIAVSATTRAGPEQAIAISGATVAISAPGSGVLSTVNTGTFGPVADTYATYSGTSMAAPHVTGLFAHAVGQSVAHGGGGTGQAARVRATVPYRYGKRLLGRCLRRGHCRCGGRGIGGVAAGCDHQRESDEYRTWRDRYRYVERCCHA